MQRSRTRPTFEMATLCLACGDATSEKYRRVLRSSSNSHLIPILSSVLQRVLVNAGQESTEAEILEVLLGRTSDSLGYICKSCYDLLNSYYRKEQSVIKKIEKVIGLVKFKNHSVHDETNSPLLRNPVHVGTKRHSRDSTSSSKRPKLPSTQTGSPNVEVIMCHKLDVLYDDRLLLSTMYQGIMGYIHPIGRN